MANDEQFCRFASPATGRAARADTVVDVQACADDRRIADATGQLVRQATRGGHAADVAGRIHRGAIDRAVGAKAVPSGAMK